MSLDFEYYKVFYYVAKYKKISVAAEKLYISQPAITQTIHKLEKQLGGNLFVRNRNGMEFTESGKNLYDFISESIETLENAEEKYGKYLNLEEGIIKIRTGSNVGKLLLYDALEKFSKDYPNIKVKIATGAPSESIKMLHTGDIDMVMFYMPYKVDYNNIEVIECSKREFVFAASKKYYKDNKVQIKKIEDFNKYSLILPKKNSTVGNIFEAQFGDKITNWHYEIAAEQMKKSLIMRNLGIGYIIKDEIKDEIEKGEVIVFNSKKLVTNGGLGIAILKEDFSNVATKKLVEYILDFAKKDNNIY